MGNGHFPRATQVLSSPATLEFVPCILTLTWQTLDAEITLHLLKNKTKLKVPKQSTDTHKFVTYLGNAVFSFTSSPT